MKLCIVIIVFVSVVTEVCRAQQSLPLRYSSRDGAYLYLAGQAVSASTPVEKIVSIRVSRDKGKGFRQLVLLARPDNLATFRKTCEETAWVEFKRMKNFSNDADAWNFILENPSMDAYGMLAFNMKFRQAMGNGYLDVEAKKLPAGTHWKYKAEMLDVSGEVTTAVEGTIEGGGASFDFPAPRKLSSFATDSVASLKWYAMTRNTVPGMILADVYRQAGGRGAYEKQSQVVLCNMVGDSALFNYYDNVQPSTLYRYYLVPHDELGNGALPSDTISILSFDFGRLPMLDDVTTTDSMNHIFITWKPLAVNEHIAGIEIQRSRDVRGDYVIIDTVSATLRGYRDTQVFPGVPYYYRFRIVGLKGLERETGYTGYVTAVVGNNTTYPDPPYGLTASVEKRGVHLQWEATDTYDLYAYFVYRGVSGASDLEVVSPGLTAPSFTDTVRLSGRTQYSYAVKAVNKNSLESEFSNIVTIRQPVTTLPLAPGGVRAVYINQHARVDWASATEMDHAIAGYNIYRRELKTQQAFDAAIPAASQAGKLGFVLLNNQLTMQTYFDDRAVQPFVTYEYAIASVDVFGAESTFSPFARVRIAAPTRLITTCAVRKITGGVEITWDPSLTQQAGALSIYRKRAGEATYRRIARFTRVPSLYVDKTVTAGTLYSYLLQAERGENIIAKSDEKNIRY